MRSSVIAETIQSADDLPRFVDNYHRVKGGDINGDPVKLIDDDLLAMYKASYK